MPRNDEGKSLWNALTPQRIFALLLVAVAMYIIYLLRITLVSVFISLFLAYVLNPIIDRGEKTRLKRTGTVVLLLCVAGIVVVLFLLYLIPAVSREVAVLRERMPEYFENIRLFVSSTLAPFLDRWFGIAIPTSLLELEDLLQSKVETIIFRFGNTLQESTVTALRSTMSVLKIVMDIILIPFFVFFFLKDFPTIKKDVKAFIPLRYQDKASEIVKKANNTLAAFFRGQIIVASILAILYSVGLSLIGIDLAIFLGILSGILFFIPYLGLGIAIALSIIISLLNFQGFGPILWILILYTVVPMTEMFILTPKIVGSRLTLAPSTVVIALLAFGGLFGIPGVIIALPSTALLKLFMEELLKYYHTTPYYLAPPDKMKISMADSERVSETFFAQTEQNSKQNEPKS